MDEARPKGSLAIKGVLPLLGTFLPKRQSESSVWLCTSIVLTDSVTTEEREEQKSGGNSYRQEQLATTCLKLRSFGSADNPVGEVLCMRK